MSNANQITLSGNMGKPAALRFTQSGKPVWGFGLAYTPRRKNGETWEDAGPTIWFDVSVWGDDATDLAERYGDTTGRATVTGRLGTKEYEGKVSPTITADAVTIHPRRESQTWQGNQGGNRPAQPAQQQTDPWNQGTGTGGWGGTGGFPANTNDNEPPFSA